MKPPNQNRRIYLSAPHMGDGELKHIHNAFETNWIAPVGPHIDEFEKQLSDFCKMDHAAVLASGTSAIHLALRLLGVTQGDSVISQSFTFAGTVNPVLYQGAKPVFIDSEKDTWNMDPNMLEDAIITLSASNFQLKAILPVHLYGMPYDVEAIHQIATKYNIPVIEDAAEALGSKYNDKPCGSFGEMAVLSFNGNKIITTSGGGALLSERVEYIEQAKFLATQARDNAPHYEHSTFGYNYRMGNINAAIGLGQMAVLEERVTRRREIWKTYYDEFKDVFEFQLPDEKIACNTLTRAHRSIGEGGPTNIRTNRWLTTILTDSYEVRERIRLGLEKENIESRPLWKPMHKQPVFKDVQYIGGTVAEDMFNRGLCLPSGSGMSDDDLERVILEIKKIL